MKDFISNIEKEYNQKIKELKKEKENKILEKIKNYWSQGDRVHYEDRDGIIEGKFVSIDSNGKVAVMVDRVNNATLKGSLQLFNYKDLL